jgi:hypothetical protein
VLESLGTPALDQRPGLWALPWWTVPRGGSAYEDDRSFGQDAILRALRGPKIDYPALIRGGDLLNLDAGNSLTGERPRWRRCFCGRVSWIKHAPNDFYQARSEPWIGVLGNWSSLDRSLANARIEHADQRKFILCLKNRRALANHRISAQICVLLEGRCRVRPIFFVLSLDVGKNRLLNRRVRRPLLSPVACYSMLSSVASRCV